MKLEPQQWSWRRITLLSSRGWLSLAKYSSPVFTSKLDYCSNEPIQPNDTKLQRGASEGRRQTIRPNQSTASEKTDFSNRVALHDEAEGYLSLWGLVMRSVSSGEEDVFSGEAAVRRSRLRAEDGVVTVAVSAWLEIWMMVTNNILLCGYSQSTVKE